MSYCETVALLAVDALVENDWQLPKGCEIGQECEYWKAHKDEIILTKGDLTATVNLDGIQFSDGREYDWIEGDLYSGLVTAVTNELEANLEL